jgi:uncharacterized membrane protein YgcG
MDPRSLTTRRSLWGGAVASILLMLATAHPALALRPVVLDGADFFKPETIDKADAIIRQIKSATGKDLMVETYPTIPERMHPDYERKGRDGFFRDWVTERGRALRVDGVLILISRDPGRLQIGIGSGVSGRLFTQRDRQELQQLMTNNFRQSKFDEGLLAGVEFVQKRIEQNAATGGTGAAGGPILPPVGTSPPALPPDAPTNPPPATGPAAASGPATQPATRPAGTQPATAPTTGPATEPSHPGSDF